MSSNYIYYVYAYVRSKNSSVAKAKLRKPKKNKTAYKNAAANRSKEHIETIAEANRGRKLAYDPITFEGRSLQKEESLPDGWVYGRASTAKRKSKL